MDVHTGELREFFSRSARPQGGPDLSEPGAVAIPDHLDWFTWRPVDAGYASLVEVQRDWTLDDVQDAHDVLDLKHAAQKAANPQG